MPEVCESRCRRDDPALRWLLPIWSLGRPQALLWRLWPWALEVLMPRHWARLSKTPEGQISTCFSRYVRSGCLYWFQVKFWTEMSASTEVGHGHLFEITFLFPGRYFQPHCSTLLHRTVSSSTAQFCVCDLLLSSWIHILVCVFIRSLVCGWLWVKTTFTFWWKSSL